LAQKKEKAFELLGRKCKKCGRQENLEVNHLNYDNLFNESIDDVEIHCAVCHPIADTKRVIEKSYDTWLRNKYERHANIVDTEYEYKNLLDWYYRQS